MRVARVNIEDSLFKYGPFIKLMMKLGSRRAALGAFVEAVIVAQKFWKQGKRPIPMPVFKREELANELIDSGMAELQENGDFVRIRGSEEQFAWLVQRSDAGTAGGIASGKSRRETIEEKPKRDEAERSKQHKAEASPSFSFSSSSSLSSSDSISKEGSQAASDLDLFEETVGRIPKPKKAPNPLNAETWEAYREVYKGRYKQEPTRNASVNSAISNFVKRIGEDSPDVAAFYVRHNKAFYVQNLHQVKHMLCDAEALHTQWKNNQQVLATTGREAERLQHNSDVFQRAAERIAARKEAAGE